MNRYTFIFRTAIIFLSVCMFGGWIQDIERAIAATDGFVTVRPEETNEILANPGLGWETFHTPRNTDKNLPNWIPSTVHYAWMMCRNRDNHGRYPRRRTQSH
jgi:hypothetical protein